MSPLGCPFISPEHHTGGADNWTLALFFYIKFKGFFRWLETYKTCLYAHQSTVEIVYILQYKGKTTFFSFYILILILEMKLFMIYWAYRTDNKA